MSQESSTRVAIVVLNFNGLNDTRECLRSIEAGNHADTMTLVVDNASSSDPTETLSREFPWCEVLRNSVNGGWAGGNNVGIRHALAHNADFVILLNNDTVISPNLVSRLITAGADAPRMGILGPIINEYDPPNTVQTEGVVFNDIESGEFFHRKSVQRSAPDSDPLVTKVDIVNGCCMMIRRGVFDAIGLIDERFFLIHEESDFCLRAIKAGWNCGVIGETHVWHKHSTTFKRTGQRNQRYYDARNLFLLLKNHAQWNQSDASTGQSWLRYARRIYYGFCQEDEAGQRDAANAVLEGLSDAILGNYGPWKARVRIPTLLLRPVLHSVRLFRRLLPGRPTVKASATPGV